MPELSPLRRVARPLRRAVRKVGQRRAERQDPVLAWLRDAERSAAPDAWDAIWANRRRLVPELARGRSFLDVGGMYGIHGELAFLAEQSGATSVAVFDAMDPTDEFAATHAATGSGITYVQGDLHDTEEVAALGAFDVVWCTGVVYHTPHPMQQLLTLRPLVKERLVLGSLVIPEVPGFEQACLLYPGISEAMQHSFAELHSGKERFPGMAVPFDTTPLMAYVNMWFGISVSALRSMLHLSGFDIVEEHQHSPFAIDIVAEPGGAPLDIYPPLAQSRERVAHRYADLGDDEVPPFAREQVRRIRGS